MHLIVIYFVFQKQRIPCYFTDYCRQSIDTAICCLLKSQTTTSILEPLTDRNMVCVTTPPSKQTNDSPAESSCNLTLAQLNQSTKSTESKNEHHNEKMQCDFPDLVSESRNRIDSFECEMSDLSDVTFSDPVINPFHSPIRVYCSDHNLPWFSNAYLFHLIYS